MIRPPWSSGIETLHRQADLERERMRMRKMRPRTMTGKDALRRIVASTLTCGLIALHAGPARASCLENFAAKGSTFKGRVYSTHEDFANLPVQAAVERLRQRLAAKEIDILVADGDLGVVSGRTRPGPSQLPSDIDLDVAAAVGGARVKMVMTLPAGVIGRPNLKEWMCDVVGLAASDGPAAAGSDAPPPGGQAAAPPLPDAGGEAPACARQEPALTNVDIIKLTQAGLAGEVIVTKIRQASSVTFDLSTDGLIALSHLKVAKEVIAAMQQRSAARSLEAQ